MDGGDGPGHRVQALAWPSVGSRIPVRRSDAGTYHRGGTWQAGSRPGGPDAAPGHRQPPAGVAAPDARRGALGSRRSRPAARARLGHVAVHRLDQRRRASRTRSSGRSQSTSSTSRSRPSSSPRQSSRCTSSVRDLAVEGRAHADAHRARAPRAPRPRCAPTPRRCRRAGTQLLLVQPQVRGRVAERAPDRLAASPRARRARSAGRAAGPPRPRAPSASAPRMRVLLTGAPSTLEQRHRLDREAARARRSRAGAARCPLRPRPSAKSSPTTSACRRERRHQVAVDERLGLERRQLARERQHVELVDAHARRGARASRAAA